MEEWMQWVRGRGLLYRVERGVDDVYGVGWVLVGVLIVD